MRRTPGPTSISTSGASRSVRRASVVLVGLVFGCGGGPDILVRVSRPDTSFQVTVTPCPATATSATCFTYENATVLEENTGPLKRTLGIYRKDATNPIRIQLLQKGPLKNECWEQDVTVGSDVSEVEVVLGEPLKTTCKPADRCKPAVRCVLQGI